MSMSFTAPGDGGEALATATEALSKAENARDMVLRRDPKLDEAVTAASAYAAILALQANYEAALTASVQDRANMHTAIDDLVTRITALENRLSAFGWQATTALTLAQAKDYVVTLNKPMPTATYTAKVFVDPAAAGKLGAVVTSQTKTTVTVRTTGLLAIGVSGFGVICWGS